MKLTALLLILPFLAAAATVGQIDTFQNGTTENWFAGGGPAGQMPPNPPTVILNGGPGGTGDAYLQITARGGNGPGSRLTAMNATQWTGSFMGITGISMDLINLGNTDLTIRLFFEDPIPGPPMNEAVSESFLLPAGSGWQKAFFSLAPGALTPLGSSSVEALLNRTTVMRIIHNTEADEAAPVAGVVGVDNIAAVPEPATAGVVALAGAALVLARRRR